MSPITHLLVSWVVAHAAPLERRDRALVTVAGVIPDADALGAVAEIATRDWDRPLLWWSEYHHVLAHNVGFALLLAGACAAAGRRRALTALLALAAFHLHLLGDLVGARGPDGYQWPIPYLLPFSDAWPWTWDGQWALNAWPNFAVTIVALGLTFYLAWKQGRSPLEMVSSAADRAFVTALRGRFGSPGRRPA